MPQQSVGGGATSAGLGDQTAALTAARRRLAADARRISRLDKIILKAQEEVGLSLILRGQERLPLEQGGYADLTGERRAAADALVLHNLRLVHSICQRYGGSGMEYEDLYQNGIPGLIRAVELFNPVAGYKFSTYATHWIRQSITRAIANDGRLIRLPVHMFERVHKVWATRERLTIDGKPPALTALAMECALTREQVVECLKLGPDPLSLDSPVGDGAVTLGDLIDRDGDRPEHVEVHGFIPDDVYDWFTFLTDRQMDILRRRFGLPPYYQGQTLEMIGRHYGRTRERIRQIENKAFERLRAAANEAMLQAGRVPKSDKSAPDLDVDETQDPAHEQPA